VVVERSSKCEKSGMALEAYVGYLKKMIKCSIRLFKVALFGLSFEKFQVGPDGFPGVVLLCGLAALAAPVDTVREAALRFEALDDRHGCRET
jgi:hypothetical protein